MTRQALLTVEKETITPQTIKQLIGETLTPAEERRQGVAPETEGTGRKECVWMRLGEVSYRLCTRGYQCHRCEFEQMMETPRGELPQIAEAVERFKVLPGRERLCCYALRSEVSYRLCTHLFQCAGCAFEQTMQEAEEARVARLVA